MSVSTIASPVSIYNMDGSLKTRQQWNADLASVTYSAAQQAQLDAVYAKTLAPYISPYVYKTSVQNGMSMNDVDTAGKPITGSKSFGPSAITQHQADLFAQAKLQGGNPTNPSDLLDMLGIARSWDSGTATPAATNAMAKLTPITVSNTPAVTNASPAIDTGIVQNQMTTGASGGASAPAPNTSMTLSNGAILYTDANGNSYLADGTGAISYVNPSLLPSLLGYLKAGVTTAVT